MTKYNSYDDAHNAWEQNKKEVEEHYFVLRRIAEDFQSVSTEKDRQNPLLGGIGSLCKTPIEEVFIDDLVLNEKGKPIENLFASLKGIRDTIKQEDIDKLPEEQRRIAQKRFKELHELVDRGQRMIDAGKTEEYTDKILGITYDMCKDGFREVASKIDISNIVQLFPDDRVKVGDRYKIKKQDLVSQLDWFNSDNAQGRKTERLGGKEFNSFTEYLASKMTREAFNTIEAANDAQGENSYCSESCLKKFAVLKSMGYETGKYNNWIDMRQDIESVGFYAGRKKYQVTALNDAFEKTKTEPLKFEQYCEGQAIFDAGIQLLLENIKDMPGIDKKTGSVILIRTEDEAVVPDLIGEDINGQTNINGQVYHPGICESHGHITASVVGIEKKVLTATRVPFTRIHTLWFMESGIISPTGKYTKNTTLTNDGDFQFWAYHQNEIDACTQGLKIIKVDGDVEIMKNIYQEAEKALLDFERKQ